MKKSKKYNYNYQLIKNKTMYDLKDAYAVFTKLKTANFDESIDLSILVENPKHLKFSHNIFLPYSHKDKKILILVHDKEKYTYLKSKYNVNTIDNESIIEKIYLKQHDLNYNYIIIEPSMKSIIKKIAPILKKNNLMPTKQNKMISVDIEATVENIQKNEIYVKSDKNGSMNFSIAKKSYSWAQFYNNCMISLKSIMKMKPTYIKKRYIKKIFLSTTISPSINIDYNKMISSKIEVQND